MESFTDFFDHIWAENHQVILIAYLSEYIHRVRRPLELTAMNLRAIAEQLTAGELEPEEIRMQLQIQVNNIARMIQTLEDLSRSVAEEQPEIPKEFREFLAGK